MKLPQLLIKGLRLFVLKGIWKNRINKENQDTCTFRKSHYCLLEPQFAKKMKHHKI